MTTKGEAAGHDSIDFGDGLKIPKSPSGYLSYPDAGYQARVTTEYDPQAGRYQVRTLTVEALGDRAVTGEMLRKVRVADLLRDAVTRELIGQLWPLIAGGPDSNFELEGPTTRTLTYVARVYRLALLVGEAPTQAVANSLRISRSTAARWVTRARDRGLLTVTDPRAPRTEE